ncbi:hypothetical protein JFU37_05325 [Pseudomonas sp. TH41]|uniref:deaminase domain-containing protein n=1 Tax=Pseudomonas sp. TH41 TaxID=2796405 RepID=UPI001912BEA8|nr:deaminase domain-containing protein [Pseudomonas sp. TH41]MBK5351929.1 hypothetical protein [Pseudomonas sp. TH41]
MQTINSSEKGGLFPPTNPTDAQLHTGQLEDYELMLTAMRKPPTTVDLRNLIRIGPFSPLHRVSEEGLNALWKLLRDRDYMDMCTKLQIKHGDLSVTLTDGNYVYQAWNNSGTRVTLALTEFTKWEELKPQIEQAATLLGGQINSNRFISLGRMSWFYGLAPWTPRHPQEHPDAILALQEKIASHQLKLEDDFDILELRRRPTDEDRAAFRASRRHSPTPSQVDTHKVHAEIVRAEIIATVNEFLPEEGMSPLTYLANDIFAAATVEQVRATPTVYLQKILQSAEAKKLEIALLSAMDWYGGELGEETSPYIRIKLIANALQLWLASQTAENPGEIAGYAWQARSNWGKSYQAIGAEFETHLRTSNRATSEKEAIVIARLFLSRFPLEFRVRDIPEQLRYRSSVIWVNFLNGVNIIKATEPELLNRLTFQQLVNLALQQAKEASEEQMTHIALARLLPALDWAETLGVITSKNKDDIDRALSELDKHTSELNKAIIGINETAPKRLTIARTEMEKLFGKDAFISDGRKLARSDPGPSHFRDTPVIGGYDYYAFLEVLAAGKFDDQKKWLVTERDGTTIGKQWIRIDEKRTIKTEGPWPVPGPKWGGMQPVLPPTAKLPDIKALFDKDFTSYLTRITTAYATLIKSLLVTLPIADREALGWGEVRIYSLRLQTHRMKASDETHEKTLPLRARNGLILQATHNKKSTYYEMLPRAGLIRYLEKFDPKLIGPYVGAIATHLDGQYVDRFQDKRLPFDWEAHLKGGVPKDNAHCYAIIDQLGTPFAAVPNATEYAPVTFSSSRLTEISDYIATQLLFVDPVALRRAANGQTVFEREEAYGEKALDTAKLFVPFWGSIEDVMSNDKDRRALGAFGLFFDVLSFGLPIGKFAVGSLRLVINAGQLSMRTALPSFTLLTKKLVTSLLKALNPIDGIPQLLKALATGLWKLAKFAFHQFTELAGKLRYYNYVRSLSRLNNAGRWLPQTVGDQLARVKGIDDVLVRNLATSGKSDFRLIDPLSTKPYGPTLPTKSGELLPGRSGYRPLAKTDNHVTVELSDKTLVREVLEADGRTTLFLDDVPYRLDGDTLRRADLIDIDDTFKAIPCRVRRAPGPVCKTNYVTRNLAPTPDIGHYDETKGWAPWFGDVIYAPATGRTPMQTASLATHSSLHATLEFQKGIYGRLMVSVPEAGQELVDNIRVGAILAESMDGSKHYVFTRLNAGDFFVAERVKGQSVYDSLTLKKANTLPEEIRRELEKVYIGSLNANNMARIYGVNRVERALKAMDDIAVPIGGHANPPETLKHIKVDTSPAEAVLFDHSTRMIVRHSTDGAATWSSSKTAPDSVRETTAEILNTLFRKTVVTVESSVQGGPKSLKINNAMQELETLISRARGRSSDNLRNIAFAEIRTKSGVREVYVSVSGSQNNTDFLPLFSTSRKTNEVKVGSTSYFNVDHGANFQRTSLSVSHSGKLRAIPHTIDNIETYTPALTSRPTSLDTESKLIGVIRGKYPDPKELDSITIGTTMAPCDSCSVVMKQFGYDGDADALNVIWK